MHYFKKYIKYKNKLLYGENDDDDYNLIRDAIIDFDLFACQIQLPNINSNNIDIESLSKYHLFVQAKIFEEKYNSQITDAINYSSNNVKLLGSGTTSSAYLIELNIDDHSTINKINLTILVIDVEKERNIIADVGISIINQLIETSNFINLCYTYYNGLSNDKRKILTVMEYGGIALNVYMDNLNTCIMEKITEKRREFILKNNFDLYGKLKSNTSKLYINRSCDTIIKNFIAQIFGCILTLHTNGILYYDIKLDNFTIMSISQYKYINYSLFLQNDKIHEYHEFIVPLNYGIIKIIDYGALNVEQSLQPINNCNFTKDCNYKRVFSLFHRDKMYEEYYKDNLNICNIVNIMKIFSHELCNNITPQPKEIYDMALGTIIYV